MALSTSEFLPDRKETKWVIQLKDFLEHVFLQKVISENSGLR